MSSHSLTDDQVISVFLSGFTSGVTSVLIEQGMPDDQAEAFARRNAKHIVDNPVTYHQLSERLTAWLVENPDHPHRRI